MSHNKDVIKAALQDFPLLHHKSTFYLIIRDLLSDLSISYTRVQIEHPPFLSPLHLFGEPTTMKGGEKNNMCTKDWVFLTAPQYVEWTKGSDLQ